MHQYKQCCITIQCHFLGLGNLLWVHLGNLEYASPKMHLQLFHLQIHQVTHPMLKQFPAKFFLKDLRVPRN